MHISLSAASESQQKLHATKETYPQSEKMKNKEIRKTCNPQYILKSDTAMPSL